MKLITNIIVRIPVNVIYAVSLGVTTMNAIAVQCLYFVNRKHRKNRITHPLSHKFQIEDNIRVLNIFKPQMFLEIAFSYTATGAAIFIDMIFHNVTALNVVYFTVSKKSGKLKKHITFILGL